MQRPYITQDYLERRLPMDADSVGMVQSDWDTLLGDVLEEESARVETYAGTDFPDMYYVDESDIPPTVKSGIVTLCQSALANIRDQGLSSKNLGDGTSYSYRPTEQIRAEVRAEIDALNLDDGTDEAENPNVRSSLI